MFGTADLPEAIAELDRRAYEATQEWFQRSPSETLMYRGVHLGELLRQHLWSKVGRALRWQHFREAAAFERSWLLRERRFRTWGLPAGRLTGPPASSQAAAGFGHQARRMAQAAVRLLDRRPPVLVPVLRMTGPGLLQALERSRKVRLVHWPDRAGRFSPRAIGFIGSGPAPDGPRLTAMVRCVVEGLAAMGVDLLPMDQENLAGEIALEWSRVNQITELLQRVRPDAVLLQTDDVSPLLCYVRVARRLGIRSIAFKHGLDCEHHFHSQAFADAIMVWGPAREQRYRRESSWQPRIGITGNPEYEALRQPDALRGSGSDWVWVTRPHDPMKCYAPSRHSDEGVRILAELIRILRKASPPDRLIVKPHPADLVEAYRELLSREPDAPVTITDAPLAEVLERARLVLSEDSTAALDAMLRGKPLILTHFAPSAPVLPLVEYGAALPGFTPDQLAGSIAQVRAQSPVEQARMWEGQQAFIRDHAGPLDGSQRQRALDFVYQVVEERK